MTDPAERLGRAWRELQISVDDFWMSYFSLGGNRLPANIEDLLHGEWAPSRHEYDLLAHALNEYYSERGADHPVPYWEDIHAES